MECDIWNAIDTFHIHGGTSVEPIPVAGLRDLALTFILLAYAQHSC